MLVFLAAFLSAVSFAETGPSRDPIDLRARGGSLEGLHNVAQGYHATNLCGFFTFSQYLDAWRISRRGEAGRTMTRASAVAIGVDHAIRRDIPFWVPVQNSTDPLAMRVGRWGSTFCALAAAVRDEGYCVDPRIPTRYPEETGRFADVATSIYGSLLDVAYTPASRRGPVLEDALEASYSLYSRWGKRQGAPLATRGEVQSWITAEPTRPYRVIRKMLFPSCAEPDSRRFDFEFASCRSELYLGLDALGIPLPDHDPLRGERASRRLHALLEKPSAAPVPFAYCSRVLRAGKGYKGASPVAGDCGLHWSLIAGRKTIDGESWLLVRNTFRPAATYSKDWIVEGGDIWVREKELLRAMLLIQWLE
jgi:hypothetical protein